MAQLSAHDQYLLELVNRARLDPGAEAVRYGVSLGSITAAGKQPLAGDTDLAEAAELHSRWMLDTDTFSHTGAGGSSPGDRMEDAGYTFTGSWSWGENIAWKGTSGTINLTQYVADLHANLFRSSGHRANILNDGFREAGMGIETGKYGSYNAAMATEAFARSGTSLFLTGVAYTDQDANRFYTPGEGRGGVRIELDGVSDSRLFTGTTADAGGYEVAASAGTYLVTLSGGGLANPLQVTLAIGSQNVKLDAIGADAIASSASLTLGAGVKTATLLGTAGLTATGNGLANGLTGNIGDNVLDGGAGADALAGGRGNDVFVLRAGEANGDAILDFAGNGRDVGDSLRFEGYGSGATFTLQTDGDYWEVSDGARTDFVRIEGSVDASDYSFGPGGTDPGDPKPIADPVTGTAGNDVLYGTSANNTMGGGTGNDTLYGYSGADQLYGGAGSDSLSGGNGADVLVGGDGADRLRGGDGADRFVFRSLAERGDTIYGFNVASGDRIDLGALLDVLGYDGVDPLGDGHLQLVQSSGNVLVRIDTDPNGSDVVTLATLTNTTVSAVGEGFFIA